MYDKSQIPILNRLPVTRIKLCIARVLYHVLHFILRTDHHLIRRGGIFYDIDLSEGIDLSLYLFGNFQGYITNNNYFSLPPDAVVFDIEANVGSLTLRFAQLVRRGRVYAFEPTGYAFTKLLRNLSLNPELAERVIPVQLFVSDHSGSNHQMNAYSSWKVDRTASDAHPIHGGTVQSAKSVPTITIDSFCMERNIRRVDLIKVDTDGYEIQILKGASKTLKKYHPYIIFEIGLYIMEEHNVTFEHYFEYLSLFGYTLINSKKGRTITLENFFRQIPLRSTTDIIAIPPNRSPLSPSTYII